VERGELKRDGTGLKAQPYRYWLPSLEKRWETDPVARLQQRIADNCREIDEQLMGVVRFSSRSHYPGRAGLLGDPLGVRLELFWSQEHAGGGTGEA